MNWLKKRLKSKTINFGLILKIAGAVQIYVDSLEYGLATMAVGIIVIVLREKTNQSLDDK